MENQHRYSLCEIGQSDDYDKWDSEFPPLNKNHNNSFSSLKLVPVTATTLYARRHSAHACSGIATENQLLDGNTSPENSPQQQVPVCPPPVPARQTPVAACPAATFVQPPVVPKRKSPYPIPSSPSPKSQDLSPNFENSAKKQRLSSTTSNDSIKQLSSPGDQKYSFPASPSDVSVTNYYPNINGDPFKNHFPPLNPKAAAKRKSPFPPPLPPTPKSRAPPFNRLNTDEVMKLPTTEEEEDDQYVDASATAVGAVDTAARVTFDEAKPSHDSKIQYECEITIKRDGVKTRKIQKVIKPIPPSRKFKPVRQEVAAIRQDSEASTESTSLNSSPNYLNKSMETPLISPKTPVQKVQTEAKIDEISKKICEAIVPKEKSFPKSVSTPVGLQTFVTNIKNGSTFSVQHKILKPGMSPSDHCPRTPFYRFRFAQTIFNALVLIAIGIGLIMYFQANPLSEIKIVNTTVHVAVPTDNMEQISNNPAPGICLPVIVDFCREYNLPYNYTIYPNYLGHFGQRDAQIDLETYDAVVDVRCYELAALFLCTIFVPKCGQFGRLIRPCRYMCAEMLRRCEFFLDVFGLIMPRYLNCELFPESPDPDICIGQAEAKAAKLRESKPTCPTGFQCDIRRCIPKDWECDGYVDCQDQTDEMNCTICGTGMIHCGNGQCIGQVHMCDGHIDCPWGQDERNCLRLSEINGDIGKGRLEVYRPDRKTWISACVFNNWNFHLSENICHMLGYATTNVSRLYQRDNKIRSEFHRPPRRTVKKLEIIPNYNMIREFASCNGSTYPMIDLVCSNYVCGKRRLSYTDRKGQQTRIVGGRPSLPGDWPFLAALLGGPEEIFYCAGVLISDQWILTASHCVGNHTDVTGWTILLGITRRHSHSFYGQRMKVKRVVAHPHYSLAVAHDNDIALFQLTTRVTYHEYLSPVCLPVADYELREGTMCTVIGWGKKKDRSASEYEPQINEIQVPVIGRNKCNHWLQERDLNITDGMICAGLEEGGKDACQGDSGGPLLFKYRDRWHVGGIVSWGIKCAHPHLPGVYAYVPRYINWIHTSIAKYDYEN